MKLEHSINALSRVSFSTRQLINPVTNEPTGVVQDCWEDISHSCAKGLEELQNRLDAIDEALAKIGGVDKMLAIFEWVARQEEKKDLKPPKDLPPEGLPLAQAKKKGGRPKKVA
jgi:hypothetical protein